MRTVLSSLLILFLVCTSAHASKLVIDHSYTDWCNHADTIICQRFNQYFDGGATNDKITPDNSSDLIGVINQDVQYTASGYEDGGADYAGVSDYISYIDDDKLSFGDASTDEAFTIAMWIKPDTGGMTSSGLFSKWNTVGNFEWIFFTDSNENLHFRIYDNSSSNYKGREDTDDYGAYDNTWYHVAASTDGNGTSGGITIYRNGVAVDDVGSNGGSYTAMHNTSENARLGTYISSGNPIEYQGLMDEVLLIKRELTAAEVLDIYENGLQ